ncbi:hypothetical protein DL769_010851 [Monosporascus sp. CRB-8-3]|nr:hypothetical protein DL769_010851 [Monosporascus sp. CRB-8-3]
MPERYEVRYFGAGPALLPTEVLEDAAKALLNYDDTGLGLAEQSHRSERAWDILKKTKADLAAFLDIPSNYEILFMQGGGSGQFSAVVYHLVGAWVQRKKDELIEALFGGKSEEEIDQDELVAELKKSVQSEMKLDYLITGSWSLKAYQEAIRLLGQDHVNVVTDSRAINNSGKFGKIAEENGARPIVVADMSSNILSRQVPIENFGVVFFGAQKNLGPAGVTVVVINRDLLPPVTPQPSPALMRALGLPIAPVVLSYETAHKNNSLYNTLPIFDVYIAGQVLKRLLLTFPNRVADQEALAKQKADIIYAALEEHPDIYRIVPDKSVRSRMNICFRVTMTKDIKDSEMEFLELAKDRGLIGLKGHRTVGGIRASNYNSVPLEGAVELAEFLRSFAKK